MATYPKVLKDRLAALDEDYTDNRKRLIDALPHFNAAGRAVAMAQDELDPAAVQNIKLTGWLDGRSVAIRCAVLRFPDVAPLLDFIEAQGYEFRSTHDDPDSAERTFRAMPLGSPENADYWNTAGITVECHLMGEGTEGCRRVILKYETPKPYPVYGFDCGDPTAIPTEDVPQ